MSSPEYSAGLHCDTWQVHVHLFLQIFAEINFADQGFPLAAPSLDGCLIHYLLTVAAMPCLAASSRFWLNFKAFLVCSFELINYASQAGDTSPLTNTSSVKEIYDGGPQESGTVRFETTIECHVALDVHTILQKWNSYHIVSTLYPGLP